MIRIPEESSGLIGKRLSAVQDGGRQHKEDFATVADYLEEAVVGLACAAEGFEHIAGVMRAAMLDGAPVGSLIAAAEWMASELAAGIGRAKVDAQSAVTWADEFIGGEAP